MIVFLDFDFGLVFTLVPDHYPSWDCKSFHQCDHGYRSPDRPCAPGTLYNAALQTCDHTENNDDTENTCEIGDSPFGNLGINLERGTLLKAINPLTAYKINYYLLLHAYL